MAITLVALPAVASAQLLPVGPEFAVNTYTTGQQAGSSISMAADGGFIVTWSGPSPAGVRDIFARRYDSGGVPLGDEFLVNTYTPGFQAGSDVAADAVGNFVIVWLSDAQDGSGNGVFAQRFDSTGALVGSEFRVNSYTPGSQTGPRVAMDANGNFVVVWTDGLPPFLGGTNGLDGSTAGVFGQRYASNGSAQGSAFQVNSFTPGPQIAADVAFDGAGRFVVVWSDFDPSVSGGLDGSGGGVFARRFDSAGPISGQFQVNSYTPGDQFYPAVATDAGGNFLIAWSGNGPTPASPNVRAQRYDSGGNAQGVEFQVNTYTTSAQGRPAIATDSAGDFVVVWDSRYQDDPSLYGVFGQRFASNGSAVGTEFQVNTYTTSSQYRATIGSAGDRFVVTWSSQQQDGSSEGIFAQRYAGSSTTSTTLPPGSPLVLGKKMLVKDPSGAETERTTIVLGKEKDTDIGMSILGDPTSSGATVRVVVNGATPSDETFVLDASGWTAINGGYKYTGPTGADGDPVRKALIKRSPRGTAILKVILKGNVGTQLLDIVPPNPGFDGGLMLTIEGGGATYCTSFGAAAGGSIVDDGATSWKIIGATGQACPSAPTTTTTSTTTSTTLPSCGGSSGSSCGTCGSGLCCANDGACTHLGGGPVCGDNSSCVSSTCTSDSECAPGQFCSSSVFGVQCCNPCF